VGIRTIVNRRITPVAVLAAALAAGPLAAPADAHLPRHPNNNLAAFMSGRQEVPANSGDQNASGVALFDLKPWTGRLCYVIWVKNVDGTVNAAHIHYGAVGSDGPHVVDLVPPVHGASIGCTWVGRRLAWRLWWDPSHYYVNVHSTEYPDGALRGQLFRSGH
jgi:hypothetical protein